VVEVGQLAVAGHQATGVLDPRFDAVASSGGGGGYGGLMGARVLESIAGRRSLWLPPSIRGQIRFSDAPSHE
jgi:hypothetical protein